MTKLRCIVHKIFNRIKPSRYTYACVFAENEKKVIAEFEKKKKTIFNVSPYKFEKLCTVNL